MTIPLLEEFEIDGDDDEDEGVSHAAVEMAEQVVVEFVVIDNDVLIPSGEFSSGATEISAICKALDIFHLGCEPNQMKYETVANFLYSNNTKIFPKFSFCCAIIGIGYSAQPLYIIL